MSSPPLVWFQGNIVEGSTPLISPTDLGILIGDGVFDTLSVRNGIPRFLDRHLARFAGGLHQLGLPAFDDSVIRQAIDELLAASHLSDARIRITATSGPGRGGIERGDSPTLFISIDELGPTLSPASLCTVDAIRNERSPLVGVKLTSWTENAALLREAKNAGFDNAVLCDSAGNLSECTTSNIFVVIDNELLTPSLDSGCLPGIIRAVLLDHGVAVERVLTLEDLAQASEVFLTSSISEVRPVYRVDARELPVSNGVFTKLAAQTVANAN